ncbi:LLM class flavin-dependent oxidoreductase [Albidovulum sediminis]|uniref:LLM class flavin-dependent oxidoreductase n=1 Tax=Albidovulum sediminis TaxID=3066345 RepID=A0ABT2NHB7_9RHOB|nr:LLM class flavin-dependent oxidoreductase [Defluviimonas sediminis]MCT8328156.1 LLM class flavin-dependent oxidoreductase [Defluviimonas sediminis]
MEFSHFLNSHLLDPALGGRQLYRNMVAQAVQAEACGYRGVSIPEHHLLNILLVPSPLQLAVKVAAHTSRVEIATSICQLPLRDMRVFAGEVVQAQALCDGRLILGVGKGAFGYETGRIGVPMEETKARFEESLAVLEALLARDEVSWDGALYRFEALTVMPRPEAPIPIALAIMAPPGIEAAAARGYHIQTTPLGASHGVLQEQVNAFHRGKALAGPGCTSRLSLQRGLYLARDDADARDKIARAHRYYKSFDNVFGGPGIVEHGIIRPLPRKQTVEELGQNVLICGASEMIDRLSGYAELGIDEVIASSNFGQPQDETLDMMARLGAEVLPHLRAAGRKVA